MENEQVLFYSEHDQLSNFYGAPFSWRGREWKTAEHAYQAAKFFETDSDVSEMIRMVITPAGAKELSKQNQGRRDPDWSAKKLVVMEEILRAKLEQSEGLREMLLETGSRELIEDAPEDGYWGRGSGGAGENQLGRLWMKLRSELLNTSPREGAEKRMVN